MLVIKNNMVPIKKQVKHKNYTFYNTSIYAANLNLLSLHKCLLLLLLLLLLVVVVVVVVVVVSLLLSLILLLLLLLLLLLFHSNHHLIWIDLSAIKFTFAVTYMFC